MRLLRRLLGQHDVIKIFGRFLIKLAVELLVGSSSSSSLLDESWLFLFQAFAWKQKRPGGGNEHGGNGELHFRRRTRGKMDET
jgi:hypothetical protein